MKHNGPLQIWNDKLIDVWKKNDCVMVVLDQSV